MRTVLAMVLVLALGAGAGAAYWYLWELPHRQATGAGAPGRGTSGPTAVETVNVRVAPAETTVTAVASLLSNESIILKPEVNGRLVKIQFQEGATVRRGEILAKLDDDVEQAELSEQQALLGLAQANFQRANDLRRSNAGTVRALDEAQAELKRTESLVRLAEARLAKRWIKTPFDARTGLRLVSLGDYLETGQRIVNLEQIDPLKVDFRIPELFLPALKPDQRIEVTVDAFPGESFVGTVLAIDPLVDEGGRAVVIRARLPNPDQRLRPGLFARVTLTLSERAQAFWLPEEALVPQGAKQFVFKVVAADKAGDPPVAKRAEITVGKRLGGQVEVVSGLGRDDLVVSAGILKVRDGAPVAPKLLETPTAGPPAPAARDDTAAPRAG